MGYEAHLSVQGELARAIREGQSADGSVTCWSAPIGEPLAPGARSHITTFGCAMVAGALARAGRPDLDATAQRAAGWLVRQAGPEWSFNYWARGSREAAEQPYPDDWDDTALALAALCLIRPEAVDGAVLARVVNLLTATEEREGGPYRTWIVGAGGDAVWQDVDLAVNSNIAYFLKLQDVDLPNLEQLADERIRAGALRSPYYPSGVPVAYFLSQWYDGPARERLADLLAAERAAAGWRNPLEAAMAVTAGVNLGCGRPWVAQAAQWLERQPIAALTQAYPVCLDPAAGGRQYAAGAGVITASLVLEALTRYHDAAAGEPSAIAAGLSAKTPVQTAADRIHERVVSRAAERFEALPAGLSGAWQRLRDRVLAGDPARQVTLLPYLFFGALGNAAGGAGDERVVELGAASLYGWLAFTVYDDFLDEQGEPILLPAANIALRELTAVYERDPSMRRQSRTVLDRMEAANAWEVAHTRFAGKDALASVSPPDYGDLGVLADRSLGHVLGCVALLGDAGVGTGSDKAREFTQAFRHFLVARQLSDDAHDWKADLERGQINAVAGRLLAEVPPYGKSFEQCVELMERHYWEHTILWVCDRIDSEIMAARQGWRSLAAIRRPEELEAILAPVQSASDEARSKQQRMLEFLRAYGSK